MATHFQARVYGEINGNPPYTNADGTTGFSRAIPYNYAGIVSFPNAGATFFPLPNGYQMGNGYVYSVINLPPSGLNTHGSQYVTDSTVSTLNTLANT